MNPGSRKRLRKALPIVECEVAHFAVHTAKLALRQGEGGLNHGQQGNDDQAEHHDPTLISVPLGSVLAWLMIRTDLPGKKVLGILITVPYMIPRPC